MDDFVTKIKPNMNN